jgi:hypothetical protein
MKNWDTFLLLVWFFRADTEAKCCVGYDCRALASIYNSHHVCDIIEEPLECHVCLASVNLLEIRELFRSLFAESR